jgi:hypothetical protein
MRAIARYDFGLNDEEFGRLTLPEFHDLWERRRINFRRQIYLHGLVASAVYNGRRTDWKQHVFSPFDFIPRSAEDTQHDEIVLALRGELASLKPDEIPLARERWFQTLTEKKVANVEEILLEVFSGLGGAE